VERIKLWELLYEAWNGIKAVYTRGVKPLVDESGVDLGTIGLLVAVYKFEPEMVTSGHLMVRDPFTAAEVHQVQLARLTARGWLEEAAPAKYRLSETGRQLTERFIHEARAAMSALEPVPQVDTDLLVDMLERLVNNSLKNPPPPDKWSLMMSYKLMPEKTPALPYIEQAMTCLASYREDAYLAAWRHSNLSAMALETLTLLWRDEAISFDDLCERLGHRGHDCQVYTNVLEELRSAGLVAGSEEEMYITARGRMFRNQIESDLERFFFKPWDCLSKTERETLGSQLAGLQHHLSTALERI